MRSETFSKSYQIDNLKWVKLFKKTNNNKDYASSGAQALKELQLTK